MSGAGGQPAPQGFQTPASAQSQPQLIGFIVAQLLQRIQTVALVKVVAVNAGGTGAVGTVDVAPMVNQVDGGGRAVPHGVIHGIPYFRLQGGAHAVIIDPAVGDTGMCGFCSRDISIVKRTKATANPGSSRTFDWADGLYFGGMLNGAPTDYIEFNGGNINIVCTGTVNITGVLMNNGKVVGSTHTHGGVQTGLDTSGPPT